MAPILKVENLSVELKTREGTSSVIDDLSFELNAGETLSFVGESGCGKSMTALGIMGLLPEKISRVASGRILFQGEDLASVTQKRLQDIRGNEISMIFQEPMTSLNPVYTIGDQIGEMLRRHKGLNRKQSFLQALDLIEAVQIPDPKNKIHSYPFQLSGGQRQRVMIAMALACEPKILVADEPTTALDVTVQAQIFELLKELRVKTNTAIILITHDMGVVYEMAQKMIVMYAGRKVEEGSVNQVIKSPAHPYTQGLISCVPHLTEKQPEVRERLLEIPGIVPSLTSFGLNKCLFESRCHKSVDQCLSSKPDSHSISNGHQANCWNLGK
jgi:oligopeptide/dipeptide ABC transporter ATP-binding protein